MIKFYADTRSALCLSDDRITTGSVGIEVQFVFSKCWEGLAKVAVFHGSDTAVDVLITDDTCTVPPEVLTIPDRDLAIGVYGTNGTGDVVIPTVYAVVGRIQRGAEPSGVDPEPPTPSLVEQLLAAAQAARDAAAKAEALAKSVRDDADAGEFDGEKGDKGDKGDNGNVIWTIDEQHVRLLSGQIQFVRDNLIGPDGVEAKLGDLVIVSNGLLCVVSIAATGISVMRATIVGDLGGGSITVDSGFSEVSENPVQNKTITAALNRATNWLRTLEMAIGSLETNKANITDIPDVSEFVTEQWVLNQGYLTEHQDLVEYRKSAEQDLIDEAQDAAIAAKYTKPGSGIPASDLAAGVIPTVPTNVSAFNNDAGYLTQHQDISGKLDKAQGVANAGKFLVVGSDGMVEAQAMTNAETEAL